MGTQDLTFAFAGDERVGAGVSGLLEAAGYPATDISNADVVFTYCINTSALKICTTTRKACSADPRKAPSWST